MIRPYNRQERIDRERGDYRNEVTPTDRLVQAAQYKRQYRNKREQVIAIDSAIRTILDDISKHTKRGNLDKVIKLHDLLDQQLARKAILWADQEALWAEITKARKERSNKED